MASKPPTIPSSQTLASVVTTARVDRNVSVASRRPKFTIDIVKDPTNLSQQLTTLERAVHDMLQSGRANPTAQSLVIRSTEVGNGGAVYQFKHGFGRPVQWAVVGWRDSVSFGPAASGHSFAEDTTSANKSTLNSLALRSWANGIVDILVF